MSTQDEARDLILNPVPEIAIRNPLSRVYECDIAIANVESTLAHLREERQIALTYAVKNNILEESEYRIEEKYRKTRTLDIDKFKHVFPDAFQQCCDRERRELEEKIAGVGKKVLLTMADALVGKTALEAAPGVVLVKEVITYGVVRKC